VKQGQEKRRIILVMIIAIFSRFNTSNGETVQAALLLAAAPTG
jgi:hypothetical protein